MQVAKREVTDERYQVVGFDAVWVEMTMLIALIAIEEVVCHVILDNASTQPNQMQLGVISPACTEQEWGIEAMLRHEGDGNACFPPSLLALSKAPVLVVLKPANTLTMI